MKQVFLSYRSGYTFSASAIRYFTYNLNTYFIYTLKETDEKGYMKLYIVKIMEELGEKVSQTIRRTDEWDKMKLIIKKLIDEIRAQNIQSFNILDINELNGLIIYDNREFKLSQDLVEILSRDIASEISTNDVLSQLLVEDVVNDIDIIPDLIPNNMNDVNLDNDATEAVNLWENDKSKVEEISNEVENIEDVSNEPENIEEEIEVLEL